MNQAPASNPPKSLIVFVTREPGTDFFIIHVPDGKGGWHPQEELDVEATYEWFRLRGADMTIGGPTEKALDHVWNFYKGSFEITNFREPPVKNPRMQPRID